MGLDTVIYFKAKPGFDGDFETYLPAGFSAIPVKDYHGEEYPEATHEIDTHVRYYGENYERGPWPHIAATLMTLFATVGVEKVWYGSDCSGPTEIQPKDVLDISMHYMLNGHRPYRKPFEKFMAAPSPQ